MIVSPDLRRSVQGGGYSGDSEVRGGYRKDGGRWAAPHPLSVNPPLGPSCCRGAGLNTPRSRSTSLAEHVHERAVALIPSGPSADRADACCRAAPHAHCWWLECKLAEPHVCHSGGVLRGESVHDVPCAGGAGFPLRAPAEQAWSGRSGTQVRAAGAGRGWGLQGCKAQEEASCAWVAAGVLARACGTAQG